MRISKWCGTDGYFFTGDTMYCNTPADSKFWYEGNNTTYSTDQLALIIDRYDDITYLLLTIDTEVIEAMFGAGLLLFVTGLGAGWLVNIIKQAR